MTDSNLSPASTELATDRDAAWNLLCEFTSSDSLLKHALTVEAAMRWYAEHFGQNVEYWGITGLLHDMDYEKFPEPNEQGHPYVGCRTLTERGYPAEMVEAIMGHAQYSGVARSSLLSKVLFAVDELSGLIYAAVLVRPDKSVHGLEVRSIKKKLKDKAFARAVSREDIQQGAEELEIDLDTHIGNVIAALQVAAKQLGLDGE